MGPRERTLYLGTGLPLFFCVPLKPTETQSLAACLPGFRDWSLPEVSSGHGETQLVAPVSILYYGEVPAVQASWLLT